MVENSLAHRSQCIVESVPAWSSRHTLPFQVVSAERLPDEGSDVRARPRPCRWLSLANKIWPKVWREIDQYRTNPASIGYEQGWPKSIFVPRAAAMCFLWDYAEKHPGPWDPSKGPFSDSPINLLTADNEGTILTALATWRLTQGIYRFDPEIYAALIDTPITGDLPCDVFFNLPEWCVYVETPQMNAQKGFFAFLDYNNAPTAYNTFFLHIVRDHNGLLSQCPIPLGKGSLLQILAEMRHGDADPSQSHTAPNKEDHELHEQLQPMISLLLYLCAVNAEIGTGTKRPIRPRPTKTKEGLRMFPPDQPTTWDVGCRLGAALRHAKQQPDVSQEEVEAGAQQTDPAPAEPRVSPRAHIRRAHWHTFWQGPRDEPEKRSVKLKWLPPIPVKVESPESLPAVIRRVRE